MKAWYEKYMTKDITKEAMRYIPKEYKKDVLAICVGEHDWDEETHRWKEHVIVEWKDGEINQYESRAWMYAKLKEIGRYC